MGVTTLSVFQVCFGSCVLTVLAVLSPSLVMAQENVVEVNVKCIQAADATANEGTRGNRDPKRPESLNGVNYIDDGEITRYAEAQVNRLIRNEDAVGCTELDSQTDRKRGRVSLVDAVGVRRSTAELYSEASKSVVVVFTSRRHQDHWHVVPSATGFFVSNDGVIATNRHVFEKKDEYMFAMTSDFKVHPIREVLAADSANDAALCRIDAESYPALSIRRGAPIGETISVISHPSGRLYSFSHGVVARRYTRPPARRGQRSAGEANDQNDNFKPVSVPTNWLTITADFGKGSSGAPVMDSFGNVIAMATSTQNLRIGEKDDQISQMVFRDCVTAENILSLVENDAAAPEETSKPSQQNTDKSEENEE